MTDKHDLAETVEAIRAQTDPTLPATLVREIIELELAYVEDRPEANKRLHALLDAHLAEPQG